MGHRAKIGADAGLPFVPQGRAVGAFDIDRRQTTGDHVETRCQDQHIHIVMLTVGCQYTASGDSLNRGLPQVD